VSAVATAGLSVGVVSATLEPGLKAVLCLDMLMGRVEVIAFLVLLYPRSWFGRKRG
jgi:trk system potassium uptake protein TrkH